MYSQTSKKVSIAEAWAVRDKLAREEVGVRVGCVCQEPDHVSLAGLDKEPKFIFISVEGHYRMKGFKQGSSTI